LIDRSTKDINDQLTQIMEQHRLDELKENYPNEPEAVLYMEFF